MNGRMILLPVMAQVVLTMAVYVLLNVAKARALRRGEVDLSRRGLHDDAWPDSVNKINNNIRNQFEVPVLFYVLSFMLFILDAVTPAALAAAWLFAMSRILHAYIHVGSNYVPTRRRVFVFGCVMLIVMVALAAFSLFETLIA